jgi:hypothetical protein
MKTKNFFPVFVTILGIAGWMYCMGTFMVYQVTDIEIPNFEVLTYVFMMSVVLAFTGVSQVK